MTSQLSTHDRLPGTHRFERTGTLVEQDAVLDGLPGDPFWPAAPKPGAASLDGRTESGHDYDQVSETLPFAQAKAHLSELADRVEREHERILVTRNGRPSFVLVSPDDLEALEETLDILRDEELVSSVRVSRDQAARGETVALRDHLRGGT